MKREKGGKLQGKICRNGNYYENDKKKKDLSGKLKSKRKEKRCCGRVGT